MSDKFLRIFVFATLTCLLAFASACGEDDEGSKTEQKNDNNSSSEEDCDTGEELCGDTCVDTDTSTEHCGACDTECQTPPNAVASCSNGGCVFECEDGFNDTNDDLSGPNSDGCDCEITNGGDEICDGVDNDCNGVVDDGFDVYQDCTVGVGACEKTGELICTSDGSGTECNVSPGEPSDEICGDGIDNDCDGEVDEDDAADANTWYEDEDGDGFGADSTAETSCEQPEGTVDQGGDCDDEDETVHPDADEVCDGIDNNCSGEVDDGLPSETYYQDQDGDGFGNSGISETSCERPSGFVEEDGDCDDADPDRHPDADELCDGVDNNCDGDRDETFTDKGASCTVGQGVCENTGTYVCSGDGLSTECNASAGSPQETDEETCDDLDNDCDGDVDEGCDDDNDGWCDEDMAISGSPAVCSASTTAFDCDDDDDTVYPGAPGLCDGKDNDCNDEVDDIKPIASANTFSSSFDVDSSQIPPKVMAAPAGDDAFCVVSFSDDDNESRVALINADGTEESQTFNHLDNRQVVDVAWDGTSCGFLYESSSSTGLYLRRWEPGSSTVHNPSGLDSAYAKGAPEERFAAALLPIRSSNCNPFCVNNDRWVIAYAREDGSAYDVVYRTMTKSFTQSSSASSATDIDTFTTDLPDVELGPSPNTNDKWMVTWYDSTRNGWSSKTLSDSDTLSSIHSGLNVDDNDYDYRHPQIDVIDDEVHLTLHDTSSNDVRIRRLSDNYSVGDTVTVAASSSGDAYVSRTLLADPIRESSWTVTSGGGGIGLVTTRNEFGWYMQPYTDRLHRIFTSYSTIGGSSKGVEQMDNSNFSAGDEYLSVRTTGDYLQVLRLEDNSPMTLAIDELTCH